MQMLKEMAHDVFVPPAGMPVEQHHIEVRVTGVCRKCAKKVRA